MPFIRPIRRALIPSLLFASFAAAQNQVPDPANLTGEHVTPQALADTLPINHGAPALQQLLLKLRTRASLMLIVAHPDDEDGGMLTLESRGLGARVANLTLTRGEGGQNLMSADFDDALGLIRTQELLAADRYFGVDQFFGSEVDFGFSKTKEETLSKWTHDRVLYDAVRVVRLYRPLVLASVFVGGVTDGHGHHQVAGEITQEVFLAAADPKVFPEMGLPPWAPLKVYERVPFARVTKEGMYDYATGKTVAPLFHSYITGRDTASPPEATVLIHEGDKATALGMDGDSYVQFARKGLALQKTQIGASARLAPAGRSDSGYMLMGSRTSVDTLGFDAPPAANSSAPTASFFDHIDTSLPSLAEMAPAAPASLRAGLTVIDAHLAEAQRLFDPAHLELTATPLREGLRTLDILIASTVKSPLATTQKFNLLHELRIKRVQLNNALLLAHGISLTPTLDARGRFGIEAAHAMLKSSGAAPLGVVRAEALDQGEPTPELSNAKPGKPLPMMVESHLHLQAAAPPTRPYFSRPNLEQPFYDIADPRLRNAPSTPLPFVASAFLNDSGVPLEVRAIVPAAGAANQPAVVVPDLSVTVSPASGIVPPRAATFHLSTLVRSEVAHPNAHVVVTTPPGWQVSPVDTRLDLAQPGAEAMTAQTVTPQTSTPGTIYTLNAIASDNHLDYREGFRSVGYPGLTYTNLYTPAVYRATAVEVTSAPNLRIAYLPGTGDNVTDFLPYLGITAIPISMADLGGDLGKYDAIVLGVRAYAAHPELGGAGSKPLLNYANNGGVVIVQYNTARYGDAESPFPIAVPGDPAHNVVEEAQPVTLLEPAAPLLNWPNKITSADFDHWVAERGHGFAASWSISFKPLLETHDPEQDPQRGGLLLASTGKGAYIYCALALYRQLPEGVPGAYRLLANLLSYAKNPSR